MTRRRAYDRDGRVLHRAAAGSSGARRAHSAGWWQAGDGHR